MRATSSARAAGASPQSSAISTAAAASTASARAMAKTGLVRARYAPGTFRAVEASGLRGADRLVPELRVADGAAENGEEELLRDGEGDELVVREDGEEDEA